MMIRKTFLALAFACLALPAFAQSGDGWLTQPYQLQIYLQAEPHPLLTGEFLGRLQREVRDTLQRDLGKTAVVEVFAESAREPKKLHPLMAEVVRQGWDAMDKPTNPITGKKVHLLRLRFEDGEYLLEGRQLDGDTGLVSPLRRRRAGDRAWVSRTAALMIGQDFGLTAAITDITEQTALFQLRAANLGQPESIGIRDGEVFALSRIQRGASGEVGRREEFALLFVTGINPNTGKCTGRIYTRYEQSVKKDPRDRTLVGFRAMKLGTLRTPLAVRVVDAKSNDPVAGCEVVLYPGGFPNRKSGADVLRPPLKLGATDSAGRIVTLDPVEHVAFARFQVQQIGVDIPVALFDDQPVTIRLSGIEEADRLAEFTHYYRLWERQLTDVFGGVQTEYDKIGELKIKKQDAEAVTAMEGLAKKLKEDIADLKEKFAKVKEMAAPAGAGAARYVKAGDESLKKLEEAADSLEKMVKEERDPSPARKAFVAGQFAYEAMNFDEAIKRFQESLRLNPNQPVLKKRFDALNKAWNIRGNAEHKAAREFFTKTWPTLSWRDMREKLDECEKKMEVLRSNQDFLTAQLLVKANVDTLPKLNELHARLQQSQNEEEQARASEVEDLLFKLREINRDLLDFIGAASGGK